jgi:molybdopterin synthase catalytic subunit
MFGITEFPIDTVKLEQELADPKAGACVTFAGWVRNHNGGKAVIDLSYEIYPELVIVEGERIIHEAINKFQLHRAIAVHRYGHLMIGEIAVWVGATASHRKQAFQGAEYIIDEIKIRLPIWKKETYHSENE